MTEDVTVAESAESVERVQARPRRVRVLSIGTAVLFVAAFTTVGVLLRNSSTGVRFYLSDQIAMIGIGLFLATASLLFMRPRVRADAAGIEVRNVLTTRRFDWSQIVSVSFPDGSPWARLELPDDEYVPVLAVQAVDGDYAVTTMRGLRRLHRAALEGRAS